MSSSCSNDYLAAHLIEKAGLCNSNWSLHLMTSEYQPSCKKMVTEAMLPPDCQIGSTEFAVSLDRENVCVITAQPEIRIPGVSNRVDDVAYIVVMTNLGVAAATYGRDIIKNLTRISADFGDIVIAFGEDRAVWGI